MNMTLLPSPAGHFYISESRLGLLGALRVLSGSQLLFYLISKE